MPCLRENTQQSVRKLISVYTSSAQSNSGRPARLRSPRLHFEIVAGVGGRLGVEVALAEHRTGAGLDDRGVHGPGG